MKVSFASLDPQEALHVAIFIEERNAEIYHRFAEMFSEFRDNDSLEIAGVFWEMASAEREHSSRLQQKYTEQYGNASCALTEEDLVDFIEVPRLERGDVFGETFAGKKLAPRERALQVALTAERDAQNFYSNLLKTTQDNTLRTLYQQLAEMEDDHVAFLEGRLASSPTNQGTC